MCFLKLLISVTTLMLIGVTGRPPQKIKGGDDSLPGDFRFMVIVKAAENICGGILMSRTHVLTAAQCLTASKTNRTVIRKSLIRVIHYKEDMMTSYQSEIYEVSHLNVHGKWIQQTNHHILEADIAILRINKKIVSFEDVNIPKFTINGTKAGSEGLVLGWAPGESCEPQQLQEFTTTVIDHELCKSKYPELAQYTFCTEDSEASACDCDIGGPFINDDGHISGIISYTTGCDGDSTNIFTDIISYKPWIQQILNIESTIDSHLFSASDRFERMYEKS